MVREKEYDLIVVGAGHAGLEASLISAKFGLKICLLTLSRGTVAEMPCNPSIGGIAKGHLVREIDALGGAMGMAADYAGIHFKMLNRSKGPAVWGPRAQTDKKLYSAFFTDLLNMHANIVLIEDEAQAIIAENGSFRAVKTKCSGDILASACVITTGTFLNGVMYRGEEKFPGGCFGQPPSVPLSASISSLGIKMIRLKTGTPARIKTASIDLAKTTEDPGEDIDYSFSFSKRDVIKNKVKCHVTYTNEATHSIIREGLSRSPLYKGIIKGIGPRYCPSIEDKVVKFPSRTRHQIFLEPEDLGDELTYPNGISTSLPSDVQDRFVRTIPGLEDCRIARYGYAVEYDAVLPHQNERTLCSKNLKGLYFAGQINGTSGYEEAAAQGLIAGINASLKIKGEPPFTLSSKDAYIGVLIEELVLKSINEPYRLFTSSAEHRLLLRADNADMRLRPFAVKYGLIATGQRRAFEKKKEAADILSARIREMKYRDGGRTLKYETFIKRDIANALADLTVSQAIDPDIIFTVLNDIKYRGYIARDSRRKNEKALLLELPACLDYSGIKELKKEARQKLSEIRPETLLDAGRIPGISQADIVTILIYLKKMKNEK